jgi:hypothetical protein
MSLLPSSAKVYDNVIVDIEKTVEHNRNDLISCYFYIYFYIHNGMASVNNVIVLRLYRVHS